MKSVRFSKHALGYTAKRGFTVAEVEKAKTFLCQAFFVKLNDGTLGLPIGAPSSPMLSNDAMR